jgi:hypothetical protein
MITSIIRMWAPQISLLLICIISIIVFVLCDLWSGIRKSKRAGKYIHSFGLRRTVDKLVKYFNFFIPFLFFDIVQMSLIYSINEQDNSYLWVFPFVSILGTLLIGIVEIKSIFEKIEKKERDEVKESVIFASKIIEYIRDKEFAENIKNIKMDTKGFEIKTDEQNKGGDIINEN